MYVQVRIRLTGQLLTAVPYSTRMTYMNARVGTCPPAYLCSAGAHCTSARKGRCPLPSWCYTRLCVVALIVQGDMLDATPFTSCLLANPVRIPELCLTRSVHY